MAGLTKEEIIKAAGKKVRQLKGELFHLKEMFWREVARADRAEKQAKELALKNRALESENKALKALLTELVQEIDNKKASRINWDVRSYDNIELASRYLDAEEKEEPEIKIKGDSELKKLIKERLKATKKCHIDTVA